MRSFSLDSVGSFQKTIKTRERSKMQEPHIITTRDSDNKMNED